MICPLCRYEWCWVCGEKYSNNHYSPSNLWGCHGMKFITDKLEKLFIVQFLIVLFMAHIIIGSFLVGSLVFAYLLVDGISSLKLKVLLLLLVQAPLLIVIGMSAGLLLFPILYPVYLLRHGKLLIRTIYKLWRAYFSK